MKLETSRRRRSQRDGEWELLQGVCLDGQRVEALKLPPPPLLLRQVPLPPCLPACLHAQVAG